MKAVIFLSGLAGLVIFGPPILKSRTHHHDISVIVHEATHKHVVQSGQENCRYEAERSFSAPAGSLDLLALTAGSGLLEVVLPKIEVHHVFSASGFGPEFCRFEDNVVAVLVNFPALGGQIRKNVRTVIGVDSADPAASICRPAARLTRKVPRRLMSTIRCQVSIG